MAWAYDLIGFLYCDISLGIIEVGVNRDHSIHVCLVVQAVYMVSIFSAVIIESCKQDTKRYTQ